MNKREAELQRCLEELLNDLSVIDNNAHLIGWATGHDAQKIVCAATVRAINRITRTLRKGE